MLVRADLNTEPPENLEEKLEKIETKKSINDVD